MLASWCHYIWTLLSGDFVYKFFYRLLYVQVLFYSGDFVHKFFIQVFGIFLGQIRVYKMARQNSQVGYSTCALHFMITVTPHTVICTVWCFVNFLSYLASYIDCDMFVLLVEYTMCVCVCVVIFLCVLLIANYE